MKFAVFFLALVVWWIFSSWIGMIFIGDIHLDWWSSVPSLGYKAALILTGILTLYAFMSGLTSSLVKEYLK